MEPWSFHFFMLIQTSETAEFFPLQLSTLREIENKPQLEADGL